ncbi:MAG TPA: hypothetical protein VG649_17720 [Candidatus Angelobacter sp.]|jgi:hypothetical protein|nr:hypothetical protein [Candidatus Angelobacter sp.]
MLKKLWFGFAIIFAVTFSGTFVSAAVPTRGSSENGGDSNVAFWKLLARSHPMTLTNNGKKVTVDREFICVEQDVDTGACDSGNYLYIFQLNSASKNVTVGFAHLTGFDPNSKIISPSYGMMVCDNDAFNSLELCTHDTVPSFSSKIGFTSTSSSATFTVPYFPKFKAGSTEQGQGLTLFIGIHETSPVPFTYPVIVIH